MFSGTTFSTVRRRTPRLKPCFMPICPIGLLTTPTRQHSLFWPICRTPLSVAAKSSVTGSALCLTSCPVSTWPRQQLIFTTRIRMSRDCCFSSMGISPLGIPQSKAMSASSNTLTWPRQRLVWTGQLISRHGTMISYLTRWLICGGHWHNAVAVLIPRQCRSLMCGRTARFWSFWSVVI